jgi:acetyl esterase/lipase
LKRERVTTLVLLASTALLAGCARLGFAVVNLPTLGAERIADVRYGDGARDVMDVYPARKGSATGRPLIVFFYGGGFTEGRKENYRFVGVTLAATGHVVVLPDYRVYPEVRYPDFVADAARAVVAAQRLAKSHGADPNRVVLAGHSAGAYIAAQLAYEPQWLRAAGGDPATVVGLIGLSGPYDLDPNSPELHAIFGAVATADEYRPLRHVRRGAPPSLLLHGADDTVVGVQHSERLAAALRAVGTTITLKIYPGRGHADTVAALSLPARRRTDSRADVSAFLAQLDAVPLASPQDARTRQ